MIPCQRHLFDLPDEVAYLNCAYLSPLLKSVLEAGLEGVRRKARPWAIKTPDFYQEVETARALFARLIGAEADDIAIIPAASYGAANAAANLPVAEAERLLVLADQFPSNVDPWARLARKRKADLVTVPRPAAGDWTAPVLAAIDERAAIVALPNCHWTDGSLVDLVAVGRRCREANAALVLDLTQSIGALPFDVGEVRPDFVVAAGYKWLMCPYSLGFMYAAPRHHDGEGFEHNWTARASDPDFKRLVHYTLPFPVAARRYDVGEAANFALMGMAVAALRQLIEWDPAETQATLRAMTDAIAGRAEAMGLAASAPEQRAGHFLGLRFPAGPPDDLVARLAARNVHVSIRGDAMRVTPHLYNNEADIERLFEALERLLDGGR